MGFSSSKQQSVNKVQSRPGSSTKAGVASNIEQPIKKPKYKRTKLLGEGTSGKVYECIDLATDVHYAMKVITLTSKTKAEAVLEIENLKRQIGMLKKLNHKNIVKYYSFEVSEDLESVEIVLQKVTPGNLRDLVKKKPLNEKEASKMCKQILQALKYLHGQGIIHRDLKGANILINEEGTPKISDFGTAKAINTKSIEDNIAAKNRSLKGTPYWMAPEVLKRTGHTYSADIWSLGCTLIEILTGNPPWSGISNKFEQIISYIASGIQPPFPPKISKTCQKFLNCCMDTTPSKRLKAEELLNHPFIRESAEDSLQQIDIQQKIQEMEVYKPSRQYARQKLKTQEDEQNVNEKKQKMPQTAYSNQKQDTTNRKRLSAKVIKEKDLNGRPGSLGLLDYIDTKVSKKQREEIQEQKRLKQAERREKARRWQEQLKMEAQRLAGKK